MWATDEHKTIANLVMLELGPQASIGMSNNQGSVQVVGDVEGYFAPS